MNTNLVTIRTAFVTLWLLPAVCAAQTTWHVDDDACPEVGTGSEVDPFCSIQAAIDASVDGDEIVVAPGTYYEAINLRDKGVHLRSTHGRDVTTIDATGLDTSVVTMSSIESDNAILQGLTVTGGAGTRLGDGTTYGGGLFCWPDTVPSNQSPVSTLSEMGTAAGNGAPELGPTIRDCLFRGNSVTGYGGAILNNCNMTVTGCTFIDNRAPQGGAILNYYYNHMTVTGCTFMDNRADQGGAIFNSAYNMAATDCMFIDNRADEGGAVHNDLTDADFRACLFVENSASEGGGVYERASDSTFTDCAFVRNSATVHGGGIASDSGGMNLNGCTFDENAGGESGGAVSTGSSFDAARCTFRGNTAESLGGAVSYHEVLARFTSCALVGNTSRLGGAVAGRGADSEFVNCTLTQNEAETGGAIGFVEPTLRSRITNCDLWANVATQEGSQIYHVPSPISPYIRYSNIESSGGSSDWDSSIGDDGGGNIDADAWFTRDPDDGGDGWEDDPNTADVDERANNDYGDLRLLPGSPCIDAGVNSALFAQVPGLPHWLPHLSDGAGIPRFLDDPDTQDLGRGGWPIVDIGAFEFQSVEGCGNGICGGTEDCASCAFDCADCDSVHIVPAEFPSIMAAILVADPGDQILVYPGTYAEAVNFLGKPLSLRSTDGPWSTVIDATGLRASAITCVDINDAVPVIDGFTITGGTGWVNPSSGETSGGGMIIMRANATVRNCFFLANSALDGGAVDCDRGDIFIETSRFVGNSAYKGGALYGRRPTCVGSTFTANSGTFGGAIYAGNPEVRNCEFQANIASLTGGAIQSGSASVDGCMFRGNKAERGGAIAYAEGQISDSTFSGNSAVSPTGIGGAYFGLASSVDFNNCSFAHNVANDGTVLGFEPDTSLPRSTIALTNCVLRSAAQEFGFLNRADLTVAHCRLSNDLPVDAIDLGGNIDANPLFVREPNDGGDGWGDDPETPDVDEGANDDYGDLRLRPGSPCINAGDPAYVAEAGETDLDGHPRVLCGRVDMGAYEFGIGDYDCNQVVDLFDFSVWASCMTAPGGGPIAAGCEAFDFNADAAVDLADYAGFQTAVVTP